MQIIIRLSLCHCNCLLCLTLLFFVYLFSIFYLLFCPMLSLPLSFLLCSPEFPHSTTMSPCLLFVSQMSLLVQFQLLFLAFPLFCPTHQVTHLIWFRFKKLVKSRTRAWFTCFYPNRVFSSCSFLYKSNLKKTCNFLTLKTQR